jgi:tetratricopeptide (TPR) repeat protein
MDFIEYAMSNYHGRDYTKALDIVKTGLQKNPLNPTMTRIAMMCSNELEKYTDALRYADELFNKCDKDSVTLSEMDYQNYGKAYDGSEQYQEAIGMFQKAMEVAEDHTMDADLFKSISDSYKSMKDYPKAIESYKKFLEVNADASATDYAGLGLLHNNHARSLKDQPEAMMAALQEADNAFAGLVERFPDAKEYGLWQRGRMNAQMDTALEGKALNVFNELVQSIKGREAAGEQLDESDKNRLFDAYSYMMRYSVKNKDNATALENALKLQELQPDDAEIKNVVEALSKVVK